MAAVEIRNTRIADVVEMAVIVGRMTSTERLSSNPAVCRNNSIGTIYSSLDIEQNTLTMEQTTAVLNGKRVLAPPKDIAEVQNAYEIYEHMDALNPFPWMTLSQPIAL